MATTAMDYEANGGYDEEAPRYERDQRSASPRPIRDDGEGVRRRSASPPTSADAAAPKEESVGDKGDDGTVNPGSNLFVTGIHPRLTEAEVTRLFEKYGSVEKCQIMRDPHTKESRGFGFVKMFTSDQADAAKEGLQNEQIEGRTLSIEKARRARPRTPTPGKYFGPPKREPRPRFDRYDDRARRPPPSGGAPGGGSYPREDPYRWRGSGYDRRADDRGYDRGYRDDRGGYDRGGYRGEYDRSGYDRSGGYERSGYDRAGYDRTASSSSGAAAASGGGGGGYDRSSYDRPAGYRDERTYDRRERDEGYGRYGGARGGEERERYSGGARPAADERRGGSYDRDRYADREAPRAREAAGPGFSEAPRAEHREGY